jgi:hypothetical protein
METAGRDGISGSWRQVQWTGGVRNGEASFQAAATAPYYVRVVIDENEGDANGVRQLSPMHDAFIYLSRNR